MNKNHSLGGMLAIGTTYLDKKDRVGTATARYSELLREGFGQGTAGYVATPSPMAAGATDDLNETEYQTMKIMTGALDQDLTTGAGDAAAFYELYNKAGKEVKDCYKTCKDEYPGGDLTTYQLDACNAGCQLALPNIGGIDNVEYRGRTITTCDQIGEPPQEGPQYCTTFKPTQGCSMWGPPDTSSAATALSQEVSNNCNTTIPSDRSGTCMCANGTQNGPVDCGHPLYTCNQACAPTSNPWSYVAPTPTC